MGAFARQRARFQRDLESKFSKGCGAAVTLVTEGMRDTKPNRGSRLLAVRVSARPLATRVNPCVDQTTVVQFGARRTVTSRLQMCAEVMIFLVYERIRNRCEARCEPGNGFKSHRHRHHEGPGSR